MILNYDEYTNQVNSPLLVLATRSFRKLGVINNAIPTISFSVNSCNEMTFRVYRYLDGVECKLWDKIDNLRLVWVKESNEYFEIKVQPTEDGQEYMDVSCTSLCEAELSQIYIHNTEINTEDDIERDEYEIPSVFYNENRTDSSILQRVLEKAPHYTIGHVDDSLKKIQRSFSFDDISIYDVLCEISQEIGCIFKFETTTRTINAYDLYQYCNDCGTRSDTSDNVCPNCGSKNVNLSYGKRTNIFFSTDNIIEDISIEYDIDEYKNCFKLKSGDDLFDATIRNINPNGTDYIYNITRLMEDDMSDELVERLNEYNDKYNNVIENYSPNINDTLKASYNALVQKYNDSMYANYQYDDDANRVLMNNSFSSLEDITSYEDFANVYYDAIDFSTYLTSKLMPSVEIETTTAYQEIQKLTSDNLSPISLSSLTSSTSKNTVESGIKNFAKIIIYGNYKVETTTESYSYVGTKDDGTEYGIWKGKITITKYGDEEDTQITSTLTLEVNDDYQNFLEQKVDKALVGDDNENEIGSVYNILDIEYDDDFIEALKLYGKSRLKSFKDSYQAGLDVLIELGQGSKDSEFYNDLYVPYQRRHSLIVSELSTRVKEINLIEEVIECLEDTKSSLKSELNLEAFLGEDLWLEFCAYRREGTYENENYISDGLDNSELIKSAKQFFELAKSDLYRSGKVGISISGQLITFMSIKEFLPLLEEFDTGVWAKVKVGDNVYTVRLSHFEIDFSDKNNSSVEFTDVAQNGKSPTQDLLDSMKSISVDFNNIKTQVQNSKEATSFYNTWRKDGLDLTNQEILSNAKQPTVVYDRNGILVTSIDDITEQTSPEQIKIVNSTIAFTDDNWESVKTALGKFIYVDPETQEQKVAFGINGEVLIGNIILGESLGIYSGDNALKFDENGLVINSTADDDGVYKNIIDIQIDGESVFYIDENGDIVFKPINSLRSEITSQSQTVAKIKNNITFNLETNYAQTQVYDKTIQKYIPDYTENALTITATDIKDLTGTEITDIDIYWSRQGGAALEDDENTVDNQLFISHNLEESVTYVCTIQYGDYAKTNTVTINRLENGLDGTQGTEAVNCKINTSGMNFISSDNGVSYLPEKVTLSGYYQGCGFLKWLYSLDALTWNEIEDISGIVINEDDNSLELYNYCSLFTDTQKNIHIKLVSNQDNVQDVITISKLKEALNGRRFELEIVSSHGNIFKNGIINTTLEAVLYEYGEVATANYDDNHFIWSRVSYDTDFDDVWNSAHAGGTKIITITGEDVQSRATFFCDFIDTATRMSLL